MCTGHSDILLAPALSVAYNSFMKSHNLIHTGEMISTPGSPDFQMIYAFDVESRFYRFCEGRSDRGLTTIYGREDGWWARTQAHRILRNKQQL